MVILLTLVGGLGTDLGPILGAVLITVLEEKMGTISRFLEHITGIQWFASLNDNVSMVNGAIFVLCVLLFRRGIVGTFNARWGPAPAASG